MVITDIPVSKTFSKYAAQLGISVAEAERAAVQVQIEKLPAIDVPQAIAFATTGNKVDSSFQQTLDTPRVKVRTGLLEDPGLCQSGSQLRRPRREIKAPVSS
mgnify:CR=1 FL=1